MVDYEATLLVNNAHNNNLLSIRFAAVDSNASFVGAIQLPRASKNSGYTRHETSVIDGLRGAITNA